MTVIEAFGATLKKYRMESDLSQEKLALMCNLDRTYIGMLERGQRQPTISTLFIIAKNLNISASNLVVAVEQLLEDASDEN